MEGALCCAIEILGYILEHPQCTLETIELAFPLPYSCYVVLQQIVKDKTHNTFNMPCIVISNMFKEMTVKTASHTGLQGEFLMKS